MAIIVLQQTLTLRRFDRIQNVCGFYQNSAGLSYYMGKIYNNV